MPRTHSTFTPHPWLRNGHLQTIWPVVFPRRISFAWERERLELDDGDFLDLDWRRQGCPRLAILSHGLEGSSGGIYIQSMAQALVREGWDVLAWNFRGCSGTPNRLKRSYHSGESQDLRTVITAAAGAYDQIALVGFSLGGNISLKYAGEAPPHAKVTAVVAISTPVDLASSALALDRRRDNRLYLRRFLSSLTVKIQEKAVRFPGAIDISRLHQIRTFEEFDGRYTAPLHGFASADDYWTRCSSRPLLPALTVPTLVLNALNDPFLPPPCFPFDEAAANPWLTLETPASGGHVGFVSRGEPWLERRVSAFISQPPAA